MGSPQDEPERNDYELQHEVTLSKGFWMADTPVTRALWETVMGENSSHFRGDERPVEKVDWKDAQTFIDKMNGTKPALKLCLPTEAQWEYACRLTAPHRFVGVNRWIQYWLILMAIIHTTMVVKVNIENRLLK